MASGALILGLAAAGGVAFLVWRQRQQAKPKPSSTCDDVCHTAGDPGGHDVCVAGCNAAGGILGALVNAIPNPFHDSNDDWNNAAHTRDENNKHLNGAVELPLPLPSVPAGLAGVEGTVARFKNGCVPFANAPGFSKCAKGTLSMWTEDVAAASGDYDAGPIDYSRVGGLHVYQESADKEHNVEASAAETFVGTQGDRFTNGPFSWSDSSYAADLAKGLAYPDPSPSVDKARAWLDRGKVLRCPPGQAPDDIVRGLLGQRGTAGTCSTPGAVGGTLVSGDCEAHHAAGFTWDAKSGTYVRQRAVESFPGQNSQCPPTTQATNTIVGTFDPMFHGVL